MSVASFEALFSNLPKMTDLSIDIRFPGHDSIPRPQKRDMCVCACACALFCGFCPCAVRSMHMSQWRGDVNKSNALDVAIAINPPLSTLARNPV
jgi:hypothetical protein